jgi:hypothetical protein
MQVDGTTIAQGIAARDVGIVGPVEAGVDQVWLTDGLVRDRIAAHSHDRR